MNILIFMQEYMLDPLEERIIHALQIEGRAPWSELAPVIGVDPVTLARRWDSLRERGLAWVTGIFPSGASALIDITCIPQQIGDVARQITRIPSVLTLDHTSGGRDLLATMLADNPLAIWDAVTNQIGALEGVRNTQTHLVTEMVMEASDWRLRALTPPEVAKVPKPRPPRTRAPRTVHPDVEAALRHCLTEDGRRPVSHIAAEHGLSEQRVADGLARLRADGLLRIRTDVARSVTGWPVYAWYFMRTAAKHIQQIRGLMARIPEARTALAVASQYNLVVAVWLRELTDVMRFEAALEAAVPSARIVDRSVVFRMSKHLGRLIDDDGAATLGFIHPWTTPDGSPERGSRPASGVK
ncbi:Lrp/AsnC family transcriptional regulator [Arthrobacter sp. AK01]|uniref:Lrp/AsnC family transcriptional regulator n=1 Tax=Micrococcaceae TaxID=1268 RepID=UPI001E508E38|nr:MULTISPECIES: Lrp/AsnC family transcriptional regulator [Micrococcaceae]MCD4853335.1 Lrp/AsnC family transcriptional regulator [Arthrobacter sp. AK01]MCP1411479.1 DNA-binding Lrp family transcriptional regulator [Paenarthrobacter sp. A20]